MRRNYLYTTFFAGVIAFSVSGYAALDCRQYTNPSTAEMCKMQNETTLSARKKDEASFEKNMSAEKLVLQKLAPAGSTAPSSVAEISTQQQAPAVGEAAPQKTDIQPVSPAFQYTPPPRVPNLPNQPANTTSGTGAGQQNGRVKYY